MRSWIPVMVAAAALAAAFAACDKKSPTRPDAGPGKAVSSLTVSGPSSVAPGATGQFTAIARFLDGSTEDVTQNAQWRSSRPDVLSVAIGGLGSGLSPGESVVSASYGMTSTLTVLVLEPGTYRLSGKVTEVAAPIEKAEVEVVSGTGAGLRTTTDYGGRYALYGVSGRVQLRASADGFEPDLRTIVVDDHRVEDIDLRPIVTPAQIAGAWSLTLTVSEECTGRLPVEAHQRTFDAVIDQQSSHFRAKLSSATILGSTELSGRIIDQAFTLDIPAESYYNYGPPSYSLVDRLDPTRLLAIDGSARGDLVGAEIGGTFDGEFVLYEVPAGSARPRGAPEAACRSAQHSMVLRRGSQAVRLRR